MPARNAAGAESFCSRKSFGLQLYWQNSLEETTWHKIEHNDFYCKHKSILRYKTFLLLIIRVITMLRCVVDSYIGNTVNLNKRQVTKF
jgi:hypothetical protein